MKKDKKNGGILQPIVGDYFKSTYNGWRNGPLWPERVLAKLTKKRIAARGGRGNLYFSDQRKLKKNRDCA